VHDLNLLPYDVEGDIFPALALGVAPPQRLAARAGANGGGVHRGMHRGVYCSGYVLATPFTARSDLLDVLCIILRRGTL
jgi:hypothetical protein